MVDTQEFGMYLISMFRSICNWEAWSSLLKLLIYSLTCFYLVSKRGLFEFVSDNQ